MSTTRKRVTGNDPVLVKAGKWFRKLNSSTNGVYRLTHARPPEDQTPARTFDPQALLDEFRKSSAEGFKRLIDLVRFRR